MDRQHNTTHQYEPLRTPSGWDEEERRLILQLSQIFDDLFRRFNRLRFEDLGRALQQRIEEIEAQIATLESQMNGQ